MLRRDRFTLLAVATSVAVAIFAIGGAPRWAQAATAVAAAVALASTLTSKRGLERRPPLVVLLIAAAGWTLVQLLPLPDAVLQALTPTLSGLRSDGTALVHVHALPTLSMDVPGTLRALVFFVILSAVAIVALRIAAQERGRYALMSTVALGAGATALISALHYAFDAHSLYGLYHPLQAAPRIMGPLLNTNHLGSLMAIGMVASGGLLMYGKQTTARRLGWLANCIACLAVAGATLSRGAMLACAAGTAVLLGTTLLQRITATELRERRSRARLLSTTLPIGIIVTCGLTLGLYIGAGGVIHQLENTSLQEIHEPTSKFAAWRSAFTLVDETPWTGIGRGAFEPVFTRVHAASAFATFSHPENEAVQLLVEWGLPATILLGALAIWMLRRVIRRWRDGPLAAGALGVLGAIVFQSNFDFGIEMLSLAVPVTIVLATLSYGAVSQLPSQRLRRARVLRVGHLAALLVGAALVMTDHARSVEEDHVALHVEPTTAHVREIVERHPLDYVAYAIYAEALANAGDPAAVPMLNHALRLHPTQAGLHRIAARLLVRGNRKGQAESEYATALRYTVDRRPLVVEMLSVLSAEEVIAALPLEAEVDNTVHMFQALQRTDLAILWLDHELGYRPTLRVADAMYSVAAGANDVGALERAQRMRCRIIPSSQCSATLAQILVRANKTEEIVSVLADVATWTGPRDEQRSSWLLRCDALTKLRRIDEATRCLRDIELSGLVNPAGADLLQRREALKQ